MAGGAADCDDSIPILTQGKIMKKRFRCSLKTILRCSVLWMAFPGWIHAADYTEICLPPDSPLPLETAASELALKTGAKIVRGNPACPMAPGRIVLALGGQVRAYPEAAALLTADAGSREWEVIKRTGQGLVVAGSSPRNSFSFRVSFEDASYSIAADSTFSGSSMIRSESCFDRTMKVNI